MQLAQISYTNDWYLGEGGASYICYLGKQMILPTYSLFIFPFKTLLQNTLIFFCILPCKTSSCTGKLLVFVGQIMLPSVFSCWLPSQQNCGVASWAMTQDRVSPRPVWQRLLQGDCMVVPHLCCKVLWTLLFVVWKVITRRTASKAMGREDVSEREILTMRILSNFGTTSSHTCCAWQRISFPCWGGGGEAVHIQRTLRYVDLVWYERKSWYQNSAGAVTKKKTTAEDKENLNKWQQWKPWGVWKEMVLSVLCKVLCLIPDLVKTWQWEEEFSTDFLLSYLHWFLFGSNALAHGPLGVLVTSSGWL